MKRIKILFILEASIGGAYTHVMLLTKNLSPKKFDISIILSPTRNPQQCYQDAELLNQAGIKCHFIHMQRNISPVQDIKSLVAICGILKKEAFDIVHTHSSKAGIIGRLGAFLYKVPCIIYTPHCYFFQSKEGLQKFVFKKLEQMASLVTNYIISVSKSEQLLTQEENIIAPQKNITIFNAVNILKDTEVFDRNAIKEKHGIKNASKVISIIGRLTKQKDLRTFIFIANEVIKKHTDVTFIIAGSGEDENAISELINQLNLSEHIKVAGYQININGIYSITDILLNTSLWEGMPYTILEGMLFKIPVVASNIPGNSDIISHGKNGCLFEKGNYHMGAEEIFSLLEDRTKYQMISKEGYEYVINNHDLKIFIHKHEQLYSLIKVA